MEVRETPFVVDILDTNTIPLSLTGGSRKPIWKESEKMAKKSDNESEIDLSASDAECEAGANGVTKVELNSPDAYQTEVVDTLVEDEHVSTSGGATEDE